MKWFDKVVTKAYDRKNRSPRGLGFGIDEGLPDRGSRYGGAQTIHNTGTIDIVMNNGVVTEVWFRCRQLPFQVSDPKGTPVYGEGPANIVAIEFAEEV
jgi:hypothetical protein